MTEAKGQKVEKMAEPFFLELPNRLSTSRLNSAYRLTRDGLFVAEEELESFFSLYQDWLQDLSAADESRRSIEKVRKKFLGNEQPKLWYLLDGKRVLLGVLLKGEIPEARNSRIPYYQANLLDPLDNLHPADPILQAIPGLKARISAREGLLLSFARLERAEAESVELREPELRACIKELRAVPKIAQRYPTIKASLREALPVLQEIFRQARNLSANEQLLIPSSLEQKSNLRILQSHGVYFALEGSKLLATFSHRGSALKRFLKAELRELEKSGFVLKGFTPLANRQDAVAKTWSEGLSFYVQGRALLLFATQIQRLPKLRKKMPRLFTSRELFQKFTELFRASRPINELQILGALKHRRRPNTRYRRSGNWLFFISERSSISACLAARAEDIAKQVVLPARGHERL